MSNPSSSPSTLAVTDAPGIWPMDKDIADVSSFDALCLLPGQAKIIQKELRMMLLAKDCSVTPVGRVFEDGQLTGLLTLRETPITAPHKGWETAMVSPDLTREERLELIERFCLLLTRLHDRGLLHGDIKPSNLLSCSDGSLRFCDFAESFVEAQSAPPRASTTRYLSPYMVRTFPSPVQTKAEDLYAAGVTVWETYTGRIPFEDVDDEDIEDYIGGGTRPAITTLIKNYLDSGDRVLHNVQK
ncbi:kinase-like protein [Ceratobasidium sp. AG-I]|nr:kinase-like protein [Ceratobasidium sp. AG-I]